MDVFELLQIWTFFVANMDRSIYGRFRVVADVDALLQIWTLFVADMDVLLQIWTLFVADVDAFELLQIWTGPYMDAFCCRCGRFVADVDALLQMWTL